MRLGVDFGTTRIVVAAADRGNYPVLAFDCPDGGVREWVPPLVGVRGLDRCFGWEAWVNQSDPEWTIARSIKRLLEQAGPLSEVEIGGRSFGLLDLLVEMFIDLRRQIVERSSLRRLKEGEALEVVLGVPAIANTNQRFLTTDAFRRAGFTVLGLLNEPSAASVEYGHANEGTRAEGRLLVYDLGGGTFDVSLVELTAATRQVISSDGVSTLGGDDFDHALAEMALEQAGSDPHALSQAEWFLLVEECRQKKEALHPNTRKIALDLSLVKDKWPVISIPVPDYYERVRPLVLETVGVVEDLLHRNTESHTAEAEPPHLEALYVTGGGSELPLVARVLRETFGRRVKRSAYTRSATAIGLAIQAGGQATYRLRDHFTRHFGVWREAEGGRIVTFDPLFSKGTPLPATGEDPVTVVRRYHPVHNIGDFRFLECTYLDQNGQPAGDLLAWDQIRFPYDPTLAAAGIDDAPITHSKAAPNQHIRETYTCDSNGVVTVSIRNLTAGYEREFHLGRWRGGAAGKLKATRQSSRSKESAAQ